MEPKTYILFSYLLSFVLILRTLPSLVVVVLRWSVDQNY